MRRSNDTTRSSYGRKKQPEAVRRALLESAATLAAEQGLAAVSIQAVADLAGVTKGGLFHHFSNKDALIDGMLMHLLDLMDAAIEARMQRDPQPFGSFTRAYVDSVLLEGSDGMPQEWSALVAAIAHEARLLDLWFEWLQARLERHHDTDGTPLHEIVRLAADGAWLSSGLEQHDATSTKMAHLRDRLHNLTRAGITLAG